jgi:hypothetical protein
MAADGAELGALDPFNGVRNCFSIANYPGYKISSNLFGKNKLTN